MIYQSSRSVCIEVTNVEDVHNGAGGKLGGDL